MINGILGPAFSTSCPDCRAAIVDDACLCRDRAPDPQKWLEDNRGAYSKGDFEGEVRVISGRRSEWRFGDWRPIPTAEEKRERAIGGLILRARIASDRADKTTARAQAALVKAGRLAALAKAEERESEILSSLAEVRAEKARLMKK